MLWADSSLSQLELDVQQTGQEAEELGLSKWLSRVSSRIEESCKLPMLQ